MTRSHVDPSVRDLGRSIAFHPHLFGALPTIERPDYAPRMLEDRRANFSMPTHGARPAIGRPGVQAEHEPQFAEPGRTCTDGDTPAHEPAYLSCRHARSPKAWMSDPDGVARRAFLTRGDSGVCGDGTKTLAVRVADTPDGIAP